MLFSADMAVASEAPASFRSSAIRPRPWTLVRLGFEEILSRRRLIRYLVQADLKKKGSDTILGNVWWIVDPLLQMLVYVVLVSVIFDRPQPDYALWVFSAILPWKWFTSSINDGIASVVGMERLIKQINFPKLVLPVSGVVAGIANFFFGLIPLGALILLFYPDRATPWLLLIPAVAAVQFLFSLSIAIVVAAVNVFYRDVGNLARHVLRLYFYVSPGLYTPDLLEKATVHLPFLKVFLVLNPWAILFTSYHNLIYGSYDATTKVQTLPGPPEWKLLAILSLVSVVLLALAVWFFKRLEPTFAKVL
jgi:ABC-type polysaccharide/polyol phosphate export permease